MPTSVLEKMKSDLLDALTDNVSIDRILFTAEKMLGNPILVFDLSFRIIASSSPALTGDSVWKTTIQQGFFDEENISMIIRSEILQSSATQDSEVHDPVNSPIDKTFVYIKAITINKNPIAYILVCDLLQPFKDYTYEVMKYMQKIVTISMSKSDIYHSVQGTKQENFLVDLLTSPLKPEIIALRIKHLKLNFSDKMCILAIPIHDFDICKIHHYRWIQNEIITALSNPYSVIFKKYLVFVLDLPEDLHPPLRSRLKLNSLLEKHDLRAGFSNSFSDLSKFSIFFRQACVAAEEPHDTNQKKYYGYYGGNVLIELISTYLEHKHSIDLVHPAINILEYYDKKSKTNYLHTLEVYLKCFGNMKKAAEALDIHYNTMKYRINFIEKITNFSLKDSATFLNMYISFQANKFLT